MATARLFSMNIDAFLKHFDHHDQEFAQDPYAVYEAMVDRCPVVHSDAHGGYWLVSGYEETTQVLKDDYTFSSADGVTFPSIPKNPVIPIEIDPPDFFKWRRLLNPWFSPSVIARREDDIRVITRTLLEAVLPTGKIDFVADLARPMPGIVTLRLLGLPEDNLDNWLDWIQQLIHLSSHDPDAAVEIGLNCYTAMAEEMVQREEAGDTRVDDLLGFLMHTEVEGRPIEEDEIMGIVFLMLFGGLDTTGAAISNAVWYLDHHPEDRQRLIDDPALIPTAVEEFLRFEAPVQGLHRRVVKDCTVGNEQLAAGDHLYFLMGAANRDPKEFADPGHVILDRFPNRHLSFGIGNHRCLGQHLGRLEFRIALEEILRLMPDFRLDRERARRWSDIGVVYGYQQMPATFTPALSAGSDPSPTLADG